MGESTNLEQGDWKHNERVVVVEADGQMRILKEESYQNEVQA